LNVLKKAVGGEGYWDIKSYIISQYLFHAIIYRDIIYDFISQYHHPPQTTAIYRDFKKSTAIAKGYNVGLRYIKSKMSHPLCLFSS